jgi:hypothetical protein
MRVLHNPNPNLAFFGQQNGGRGRGSNRGRNQGFSFNSRECGFAPTNQASTQYGHGFAHGTNRSYAHFPNNNTIGRYVQQKGQSYQLDFSQPNQYPSYSHLAPQCQICGRTRHIVVKCWYRYYYSFDTNENLSQDFAATTGSDP